MATEALLAAGNVRLFGVAVTGLEFKREDAIKEVGGTLATRLKDEDAELVRVYGFSFEGQYYDLARPAIYLVFGEGKPVDAKPEEGKPPVEATIPKTVAATGLATEPPELVGGLKVWTLDQSDFSLRLELDVGPIERILLETEIGPDQQRAPYAGQNVRSGYAGQNVRYAGQNARLRYAGQNARLQGGSGD